MSVKRALLYQLRRGLPCLHHAAEKLKRLKWNVSRKNATLSLQKATSEALLGRRADGWSLLAWPSEQRACLLETRAFDGATVCGALVFDLRGRRQLLELGLRRRRRWARLGACFGRLVACIACIFTSSMSKSSAPSCGSLRQPLRLARSVALCIPAACRQCSFLLARSLHRLQRQIERPLQMLRPRNIPP